MTELITINNESNYNLYEVCNYKSSNFTTYSVNML